MTIIQKDVKKQGGGGSRVKGRGEVMKEGREIKCKAEDACPDYDLRPGVSAAFHILSKLPMTIRLFQTHANISRNQELMYSEGLRPL